MGVVLKNIYNYETKLLGDLLFTHFGISGPLVYKISSLKAYDNFPYELSFDLYNKEFDLQYILNSNHIKNYMKIFWIDNLKKISL